MGRWMDWWGQLPFRSRELHSRDRRWIALCKCRLPVAHEAVERLSGPAGYEIAADGFSFVYDIPRGR